MTKNLLTAVVFLIVTSLATSSSAVPLSDIDINTNSTQATVLPTTTTAPATTSEPIEQPSGTELPEFTSKENTTTFTCYGRINGYYADVKLGCRVYHFCTKIEGLGEISYQRMSYICLEGSIFDQKDLNCVHRRELKVPCDKAEDEYERSNKQFDVRDESQPSMSDSLAATIMMNPIARFIAGR